MEKIDINKDACIGCGMCVHSFPEYLVFDEMGTASPVGKEVTEEDKKGLLEVIENCPTEAIKVVEE